MPTHPTASIPPDAEGENPASWRSTDEYRYPVPKPQGDHWEIILEQFLAKDKFQCDAWKDEVQNLLLFAGLFSAVVTAFSMESYKTLQPDPNTTMITLLARITAEVDTLAKNTESSMSTANGVQPPASFSPSSTSIHINIFWFSSLILSLTTVIIGIVSLQWLREHQRYTEPLTSKQALAVFHLRSTALKKWGISHIFTTLPLILQAAVVLFFIGLGEFLFVLSPTVAIPAFVLIGLPVMFLIATTILPTIQLFFTAFRLSFDSSIPTQCAYKSPQSWAFLHFCLEGIRILSLLCRLLHFIPCSKQAFLGIERMGSTCFKGCRNALAKINLRIIFLPLNTPATFNHQSWVDFDISWLTLRDLHYLCQKREFTTTAHDKIRPHYDVIQSLVLSAKEHVIHEQVALAAYHAMKELCDTIAVDEILDEIFEKHLASRVTLLQCGLPPFRSMVFGGHGFSFSVMRDEMMLAFLRLPGINECSSNRSHPTGLHRMELFTRTLIYNHLLEVGHKNEQVDPAHPFMGEIDHVERARIFPADMVQQQYLVLEHIFYDAFNPGPSTLAIFTQARHAMLTKYFNYIAWCQGTESQEANFISVISTISRSLTFSLESRGYDKADFLFFCTRLYLDNLAGHRWFSDLMKFGPYKIRGNVVDLLEAMLRYEHQLNKATYCKMTTSLELNSRGWNGHNSHCSYFTPFPYKPISERLLRFIPFERRIFSPDTQGQDSVGTITFR